MKWKPFFLLHAVALFLFASWLYPPFSTYWDIVDTKTFHYLNATVKDSFLAQIFWGIGNVRAVDLVGAIFMIWFLILYVLDGKDINERKGRAQKMIFLCIWGELGILFTKEVIDAFIQKHHLLRESPTVLFSNAIMLSESVPWLKIKDFSRSCFPGDHAEIAIQWMCFIAALCGFRYAVLAFPFVCFFILPRLIGGAHWLSDVLVGSLPIALIVLAWACYSSVYYYTWRLAIWIGNKLSFFIRMLR